ncbi:uncharacterized protein LOC106717626 [Papilio machaon]|uniref:uncharacterized protein LOC106717626 n=1 Tax=Papilio machaon TaxID=76193 RepID=UPI001E6653FC|nr:uncharacterized protein LOC106717626 [Papilio machaon]
MRLRWIILICTILVGIVWCWDVLADMGSRRLGKDGYVFKNEYIFGDCKNPKKIYYEKHHKTVQEIQRASIIRDWLYSITRIPTCIILEPHHMKPTRFVSRIIISKSAYPE